MSESVKAANFGIAGKVSKFLKIVEPVDERVEEIKRTDLTSMIQ